MRTAQIVHGGGLLNQHVLEGACVLIQDAGSLDTEMLNDGASCVAEIAGVVRLGRRSLRGSLGL